ncbi:Aminopeptidase N [Thalassocella blandensis]|nr:Aminopeptidase N [Thalassocella blandensis]
MTKFKSQKSVWLGMFILVFAMGMSGCSKKSDTPVETQAVEETAAPKAAKVSKAAEIQPGEDYHSFANPESVVLKHINLDLTVDFDKKVLSGTAELQFDKVDPAADTLVLDTRDLTINSVTAKGQDIAYQLGEPEGHKGAALSITLPEQGDSVVIDYTTSPKASGLQWLTPAQTAGKQHPFLFTQAQATHARSFIPLQDSPKVRITYNATIHTPPALLAVMSAANDPEAKRDGEYTFTMPQAIPSYLIALGVGDLQFKAMGERTGVYAEPSMVESAAAEFADTESMLIATEKRYGPYRWDRYDLLILPPSFPFGGMENPRLSFITPTVIAGDKSLVSLIAHELAHSWSGNTVTNATWRDLWLNEGFTTYLTYRIMEIIYGTERFDQEAVLGYQDLEENVQSLDKNDQILAIDLRGRDPDDVFSNIPYEKGALFLREIEQTIGRENFDAFLLQYFQHFAFQSITTDQFIVYLKQTLLKEYPEKLSIERVNQWVFEPGIPEGAPKPTSNAFDVVDEVRAKWLAGEISAASIDTQSWTVHQWLYFLNNLPNTLSADQMAELDKAFNLTESKNNEIAHSWLMHVVYNWYEPALPRLHRYLVSIGRNKLVKPLYKELAKTDAGKAFGKKAFEEAKPGYHPLTVKANEGFFK